MAPNQEVSTIDIRPVKQLGVRVEESLYRQMKVKAAELGLRDWEVWEYAGQAWLKAFERVEDSRNGDVSRST